MMNRLLPWVFFIAIAVAAYRPIIDADMYLGVATGNLVLQTYSIPRYEVFSWSARGRPYIAYEWLSQAWIALIYDKGGISAVSAYVAILFALSVFILYRIAQTSGHSFWVNLAITSVVAVLLYPFFTPRPYILGILFFLLIILTLFKFIRQKDKPPNIFSFLWTVPLTYLWSNMHPSFLFAPYLFISYGLISSSRRRLILLGTAASQILVTLLPPFSIRPYQLFWNILVNLPFIQAFYDEWKPLLTHPSYALLYLSALSISIILLLLNRRLIKEKSHDKLSWLLALPFLPFIIAPFFSLRHLPWGIIGLFGSFVLLLKPFVPSSRLGKKTLVMLIFLIFLFGFKTKTELADANWHLPQTALAFLRDHHMSGRMFNDMPIGGYLAAELYPTYQTFFDGRAEVFECCELRDYYALSTQKNASMEEFKRAARDFVERYNFSYLVIPTSTYNPLEFSTASLLADILTDDPNWRLVYVSDMMRIIVKNDGKNDKLFGDGANAITPYRLHQYRQGKEQEAIEQYRRIISLKDSGIAESGLGQAYLATNEIEPARAAFQKATELNPRLGRPYVGLATVAILENNIPAAIDYLKKSLAISPYLGEAYLLLGSLYHDTGQHKQAREILNKGLNENIDLLSRQKIIQKLTTYDAQN